MILKMVVDKSVRLYNDRIRLEAVERPNVMSSQFIYDWLTQWHDWTFYNIIVLSKVLIFISNQQHYFIMYLFPSTIHGSMTGHVTYAFITNFILIIGLRI